MKHKKQFPKRILVLILILLIACAVGCDRGAAETMTGDFETGDREQEDILAWWKGVLDGDNAGISQVKIEKHTVQSIYSSFAEVSQAVIIDDPDIMNSLLDAFDDRDISVASVPKDAEGLTERMNAKIDKQVVSITLYGLEKEELLGIKVYEDNTADICNVMSVDGDRKVLVLAYSFIFEEDVFERLDEIYNIIADT